MKVTLLKDIGDYKAGVVDVSEERANYWKAMGVVKGSEKKEEAAPAPTVEEAKPKRKVGDVTTKNIKK